MRYLPLWIWGDEPFPPEWMWQGWVVAYGGDLSPKRLLTAYREGIFPWYSEDEPIRWCSPDPRAILPPQKLHIPRRLWREWKKRSFNITADTVFTDVIWMCSKVPRPHEKGTWITKDMIKAYIEFYELGYAHSVEVWQNGNLVGGLYGVYLGPIFVGESMFHTEPNTSKLAFLALCGYALLNNIKIIDCQVISEHLSQFGVYPISRKKYLAWLRTKLPKEIPTHRWELDIDKIHSALLEIWDRQDE
ncbi:MAG: leucyl/phenylalanyl-tRNA--protein transferase [Candidatus Hydrogenedentes bacterium]|nr:leucyl/phenylalanyl-tRNA--protein transferase [Candidatus Hydrogenedentota bacterium]